MKDAEGPLAGLKVLDVATLFAGPQLATMLGDFGADVIKVEHPKGDPVRRHGHQKNGIPLWWKVISRNKRTVTLNLSNTKGAEIFKDLARGADVLVENFRPGTLERWGLGWEVLRELNPRLVMVRVTGFGQEGPYASRPGFGTLAESMSGFAHITGAPDGPPTLPPFGLADGVCAMAGTWAVSFALLERERSGQGQMIDLSLYEPLLFILGPQPTVFDQLGVVQQRTGNRSVNNAPRNTYRTRDGKWVAISTSSDNIARRVMVLVGHPEVIDEDWFQTGHGRAAHTEELDKMVGNWIASFDLETVVAAFEKAEAAIAPIYSAEDVLSDPHFRFRDSITTVPDPDLESIRMQNVMAKFSRTPGRIRWTGPGLGQFNEQVYGELGLSEDDLRVLSAEGVI
jgi:crotonobetainyl-CoA:carnitine CoA-transferase CaiB-like acyl-CoA transferase